MTCLAELVAVNVWCYLCYGAYQRIGFSYSVAVREIVNSAPLISAVSYCSIGKSSLAV